MNFVERTIRECFIVDIDYGVPVQKEITFLVDQICDSLHRLTEPEMSFIFRRCLLNGEQKLVQGYVTANGYPEELKRFLEAMLVYVLDPIKANADTLIDLDYSF